jgi:glucose-6-phosphate dehydrogenase assembly protein OpcA
VLIGDLPTALWWADAQAPPLEGELFQELSAMADQVIYDSVGWADAAHGVVATADWVARVEAEQTVADLAWRRLKPWRRLISQTLDPSVLPGALDTINEIVIEHGPHALPQAWMLIGWLACRLGWHSVGGSVQPGTEITWAFQSAHGPVSVTVRRVGEAESDIDKATIGWKIGNQAGRATFEAVAPGRLAVDADTTTAPRRILATPALTRAKLVARQLPNLGRDALFRDTLKVSRMMAKSLL